MLSFSAGTVLLRVKDTFQHRKDKLYEREFDVVTGKTVDRFGRGNVFALKGIVLGRYMSASQYLPVQLSPRPVQKM